MDTFSAAIAPPSRTTTSRLTAPKHCSNLAQLWPPNASPNLLGHGLQVVLASGPGHLPAVWVLTSGLVWFGSRPGQKPDPLSLGGCVTHTRHRTAGILLAWNRTAVPNILFLLLWLQSSIWVLIVSCHSQYVNWSALTPLSPPALKLAIQLIFVGWLWNNCWFWATLVGFRLRLNKYLSDRKSVSGRCKSD